MQQRINITAMTVSTLEMIRTSGDCVSLQVCIFHFEKRRNWNLFTVKQIEDKIMCQGRTIKKGEI